MALATAVVGAGVVSQTHLSGLARNPRTELVAVCDLDESRAQKAATEYGIQAYTDLDDLLAERDLDWIHVCTPVQTHLDVARQAAEAGVSVLIEKPVTKTLAEFEELADLAERTDVRVAPVHNQLYAPAVRSAFDKCSGGVIGPIRGVDLVFNGLTKPDEEKRGDWAFDLPGGEFEEGLSHPIYLTLGLGGYPADRADVHATTVCKGQYDEDNRYDLAAFQYGSADGALCSATMRSGGIQQRLVHLHGTRGTLTVDLVSQTVVTLDGTYEGSPMALARNNVDRIVDRTAGTVENAVRMGRVKLQDDWAAHVDANPHYYLIDEEARAIQRGDHDADSLERARWTMTVLEEIRDANKRAVPAVH